VRASVAGEVAEVLVRAGQTVEARDLLVVLQ
jgi:biotin carboxyl carrier protein